MELTLQQVMVLEMELCVLLLETLDTRVLGPTKNARRGRGRGVAGPRMGLVGL
jgi:hypothetical protein